MSTGCECVFLEYRPGEWWYLLEDYDAPRNSWDWREYATAYGPFVSFDLAHEHLHNNHANPGGFWKQEYSEKKDDPVLAKLIKEARLRAQR